MLKGSKQKILLTQILFDILKFEAYLEIKKKKIKLLDENVKGLKDILGIM